VPEKAPLLVKCDNKFLFHFFGGWKSVNEEIWDYVAIFFKEEHNLEFKIKKV
jgi:hypothetical protein